MALTEFLLARCAEAEADARAVQRPGPWRSVPASRTDAQDFGSVHGPDGCDDLVADWHGSGTGTHIARHDPSRVLTDLEAKRQIIEMAGADLSEAFLIDGLVAELAHDGVLKWLATAHADHPDYQPEWRP